MLRGVDEVDHSNVRLIRDQLKHLIPNVRGRTIVILLHLSLGIGSSSDISLGGDWEQKRSHLRDLISKVIDRGSDNYSWYLGFPFVSPGLGGLGGSSFNVRHDKDLEEGGVDKRF